MPSDFDKADDSCQYTWKAHVSCRDPFLKDYDRGDVVFLDECQQSRVVGADLVDRMTVIRYGELPPFSSECLFPGQLH